MSDPYRYPYYLGGRPLQPNTDLPVFNKFTGSLSAAVAKADEAVLDEAIGAAVAAFEATRKLPSYRRQEILSHVVGEVTRRQDDLARILCTEVGKPIRDARGEVGRAIDTFRIAAEEAVRITGEYQPLDISKRAEGVEGIWRRFPVGPCSFITPFNFPLNLVAHKVAPAIAVGCPFVLKPASATPVSALLLGEILAGAGLPEGAFSILPCDAKVGTRLATDERIKLLSFTGSAEVGWELKRLAGKKKVLLELGGNAAVIVDDGVELERAAERIIVGAFYQSGQSCISVQRIIVHRAAFEPLKRHLADKASKLKIGDPMKEDTFLGPLISVQDAKRVEEWVAEAVAGGGRVICGGRREEALFEPTLLENVKPDMRLSCQEAFGPVAILEPFDDFGQAVRMVNAGRFGLQAGVFTASLDHAFYAFNEIEAGGVIINDVPSFRVDSMPYGGVKDSGFGREGVRFAMEEMTEIRLMVLNRVGRL